MFEYKTTFTEESKTCPGVRVVYHRFTSARRRDMRLDTANVSAKLRELSAKLARTEARVSALAMQDADKPLAVEVILEMTDANMEASDLQVRLYEIARDEMEPQWLKWGVAAIEGLVVNGEQKTVSDIEYGPPELYREIIDRVKRELGFTEAETKNSSSPSTLPPGEAGEKSPTTATTANKTTSDSGAAVIADDTLIQ